MIMEEKENKKPGKEANELSWNATPKYIGEGEGKPSRDSIDATMQTDGFHLPTTLKSDGSKPMATAWFVHLNVQKIVRRT